MITTTIFLPIIMVVLMIAAAFEIARQRDV